MATAAFGVLDALFPAQHDMLQTQYDTSLAAIPEGKLKQAGINVGNAAAHAMLAEGHDGRLGPISAAAPRRSGLLGAARGRRHPAARSEPLGRHGAPDSALLFAMMDLTAADAQINCWNDKYYWGFWRPIAAIREADTDGNPATEPDPDWTRFTPPSPDHPSGALCFNSSSLHALQAFFGTDEMTFYVTSVQFPGEQRYFDRFSDVISELIEARI